MGRPKIDSEQVNVRLPSETVERLDAAIATYGRRSRNQVCGEIIEFYLPFWEEIERERKAVLERQRAALSHASASKSNIKPK